jgi:hypothetical protein
VSFSEAEAKLFLRSAGAGGDTASSTLTDRLLGCGGRSALDETAEEVASLLETLLETLFCDSESSSSSSSTTSGPSSSDDDESLDEESLDSYF